MSQLKEKLEKEIDYSDWAMLHWNFVHDSLFIVKESESLLDSALAIAENDQVKVAAMIEKEAIVRPDGLQVEEWRKNQQIFKCLVVSPYVFAQLSELPEGVELVKEKDVKGMDKFK